MRQYFSNNLSLKSLMYKIREQNVVLTASKPNNVIDVNIVYRIFEFIKVKKKKMHLLNCLDPLTSSM